MNLKIFNLYTRINFKIFIKFLKSVIKFFKIFIIFNLYTRINFKLFNLYTRININLIIKHFKLLIKI